MEKRTMKGSKRFLDPEFRRLCGNVERQTPKARPRGDEPYYSEELADCCERNFEV